MTFGHSPFGEPEDCPGMTENRNVILDPFVTGRDEGIDQVMVGFDVMFVNRPPQGIGHDRIDDWKEEEDDGQGDQ